MQRIKRGASLAQYAIVIALVMTAMIPGYFLYGKQIVDILTQYTNIFAGINDTIASESIPGLPTDPPSTPPTDPPADIVGPLGGTPAVPVRSCSGDTCSIDFGSFVIDGIRDNYPGFVETSGTAGGAEELALVLDQIATAAENGLIDADSKVLRDLANLGHDVAFSARQVEDQLDLMRDGTTDATMIKDKVFDYILSLDDTGGFSQTLTEVLGELPAGTQEEQNLKSLVEFLGNQVVSVNDTFIIQVDPVVAALNDSDTLTETQIDDMLNLNASNYTDLDSQIICHTGDGTDHGTECH